MNMYFATCELQAAIRFLSSSFPEKSVTKESAPKFFEAVKKDYFRVCDPSFHPKGMIIAGNNYEKAPKEELDEAEKEIRGLLA